MIQTFDLAREFFPIYVTTDICNSFQDIKHTHTSLLNESNVDVFIVIVSQSSEIWKIMVVDTSHFRSVFFTIKPIRCKNIAQKFNHHRYRQTDRQIDWQTDRRNCHSNSQTWSSNIWCLQKEMATYRHWSVSLWRDPDDVTHCWILSPIKTEWQLISATLCG